MRFKTSTKYFQFILMVAIVFVINVISTFIYTEIDLTDDDRFTLSENTQNIVAQADDNLSIRVLLDGEFPAGFKRLQTSVKDILDKFRDINSNIVFEFEDPSEGSLKEIELRRKVLQEDNIVPVSLSYSDGKQLVQKEVFPFAIVHFRQKKFIVNLLEEQKPGDDEEVILNKSVALLE
ncbi:MAG: Gldg family protein, partial [Dokdonella sp.]